MSYYDTSTQFGNYLSSGATDNWAYVTSLLTDLGLGGLSGWAQDKLTEYGSDFNADLFTQQVRETNDYKTRFKAIEIAKKNGTPVPTEAEVIGTEKQYQQIMQQAGLPASFYDSPDDYANLIGRGVSASELQTRVLDGYTAVRNDPAIQSQLDRLYGAGLSDGDLVAFYLDPDKATSAIELRQSAATIASKSSNTGFGNLSQLQAETLAGQGVTSAQAQQGFGNLAGQNGLFDGLVSENGNIDKQVGLDSQFNQNAQATDQLERRRAARQAAFSGGGSYSSNNKGLTGVATSNI